MAFHRCCIQHEDGNIIAEDVNLTIEETQFDGTTKWYGTISITHLADLTAGKRYRLVLDDGRVGEFLVRRNTFAGGLSGADRAVSIQGTGPLT